MRRSIRYGLIILGVCIVGGIGLYWLAGEGSLPGAEPEIPAIHVGYKLPELTLTIPWNGEKLEVPPPVVLPEGARKSRDYRKWLRIGNFSQLSYTNDDGRTYVAQLIGLASSSEGRSEIIPKVSRYRHDGTLEAETSYSPKCLPVTWTVYDTDGKTVRVRAVCRPERSLSVDEVTFFPADGRGHGYRGSPDGTVRYEWECDEEGKPGRLLNSASSKGEDGV